MVAKKKVYEINNEIMKFANASLNKENANLANQYFYHRDINDEDIKEWNLGWLPYSNYQNSLLKHLSDRGYSNEELLETGFFSMSKKNVLYPVMYNRVLFPILDNDQNCLGFGGRIINEDKKFPQPKYLNNKTSPVFKKPSVFFGLNNADLSDHKIIICEGYMDVLAMQKAGFKNAVATLGTAFTADHVDILKDNKIFECTMLFDGDEAGVNAAIRTCKQLGKMTKNLILNVNCVILPENLDPDEFLKKYGADALRNRLEVNCDIVDFALTKICGERTSNEPSENIHAALQGINLLSSFKTLYYEDVIARKYVEDKMDVLACLLGYENPELHSSGFLEEFKRKFPCPPELDYQTFYNNNIDASLTDNNIDSQIQENKLSIPFPKDKIEMRTNSKDGSQFYALKIPNGIEIDGQRRFGFTTTVSSDSIEDIIDNNSSEHKSSKYPTYADRNVNLVLNSNENLRLQRGVEDKENPGTYKTITVNVKANDFADALNKNKQEQKAWVLKNKKKSKSFKPKGLHVKGNKDKDAVGDGAR